MFNRYGMCYKQPSLPSPFVIISYIEIKNIFHVQSYQDDLEEYVRSHLDQIILLYLYVWSIVNKLQCLKTTQTVALLYFIHSQDKRLLQQTGSDEGKTLISRLTTAFLALYGYAVDIVSSKRDSVMHGEQTSRSFFQLLKLESGDDDDVNYQLYRQKLNGPQSSIVYREIGAFQWDIFESEF
ncbi:unnamed protein product [Rotaria sp. Silwood1]|nr:unnamed protein product [Rotaria sp. Silwood1]